MLTVYWEKAGYTVLIPPCEDEFRGILLDTTKVLPNNTRPNYRSKYNAPTLTLQAGIVLSRSGFHSRRPATIKEDCDHGNAIEGKELPHDPESGGLH
jgi:hypothetical protein